MPPDSRQEPRQSKADEYAIIFDAVPFGTDAALTAGEIADRAGVERKSCGTKLTAMFRKGYGRLGLGAHYDEKRSQKLWWRDGTPPPLSTQNVADPRLTPERRAALFVLNDLRDKLTEMVLHDETEDEYDNGYMAAVEEIEVWLNER